LIALAGRYHQPQVFGDGCFVQEVSMKAKGLFYIRLRDSPAAQDAECYEFRHLFVEPPSLDKGRWFHRRVALVALLIALCGLCEWALRLFV
jgi:hypothetical protein